MFLCATSMQLKHANITSNDIMSNENPYLHYLVKCWPISPLLTNGITGIYPIPASTQLISKRELIITTALTIASFVTIHAGHLFFLYFIASEAGAFFWYPLSFGAIVGAIVGIFAGLSLTHINSTNDSFGYFIENTIFERLQAEGEIRSCMNFKKKVIQFSTEILGSAAFETIKFIFMRMHPFLGIPSGLINGFCYSFEATKIVARSILLYKFPNWPNECLLPRQDPRPDCSLFWKIFGEN